MNKLILLCLISIICIYSIGCQEREEADEKTALQALDVAAALGMDWWFVELPDNLGSKDYVGLAYKQPDGSIEWQGGMNTSKWGSIVKVFLWKSEDNTRFQYAILCDAGTIRGSLEKKTIMTNSSMPLFKGKKVNAGDVLMKFYDKSVTASSEIQPGELGLILHIKKSDEKAVK